MEFELEISLINDSILAFNDHLRPEYHIPEIDLKIGFQTKAIVQVVHGDWNAFQFPNNGTRGVYFMFGKEMDDPQKKGIYIGKSSFNSSTSARMYQHLTSNRDKPQFMMNCGDESYIIDYLASVNLDEKSISFFASALEEFLILNLKEKMNLLNGTGNT